MASAILLKFVWPMPTPKPAKWILISSAELKSVAMSAKKLSSMLSPSIAPKKIFVPVEATRAVTTVAVENANEVVVAEETETVASETLAVAVKVLLNQGLHQKRNHNAKKKLLLNQKRQQP